MSARNSLKEPVTTLDIKVIPDLVPNFGFENILKAPAFMDPIRSTQRGFSTGNFPPSISGFSSNSERLTGNSIHDAERNDRRNHAYFWCLPMPSLVVCQCVKVDKVSLGLWSGWAEHQTMLPPLHLLHLNTKITCRCGETENTVSKLHFLIILYFNDAVNRITWSDQKLDLRSLVYALTWLLAVVVRSTMWNLCFICSRSTGYGGLTMLCMRKRVRTYFQSP